VVTTPVSHADLMPFLLNPASLEKRILFSESFQRTEQGRG
jgi:hypothetical protein